MSIEHSPAPEIEISAACTAVRLRVLHRAVTALYDRALRRHGVTVAQFNLLVASARLGSPRATDLVSVLAIEKSTLSRNLRGMEEQGWIRLSQSRTERGQTIEVTAAGRRLLQRALPDWQSAQSEAEALLGEEGVAAIRRLARRVSKSL